MNAKAGDEVRTGAGVGLRLGTLIKSGGAGSVFRLQSGAPQVAKLYHRDIDHAHYEHKLAAMLALTPDLPELAFGSRRHVQIAWPQDLLRDHAGRFIGFLMPAVDVKATSELECVLQERQARSLGLPTGLGPKVTLAANLSAVIAALHRQGHHVVDLKPVNLRFYPDSLYMALLDCDGFSIRGPRGRFHAPQFTPDYLAPEFHRSGLNDAGEEAQDRFALAVVIFQLLNFGIHPFTGRPLSDQVPTDVPGRIAERCYPYGLRPHAKLAPNPVSSHAAMPQELRQMFDRAFEGPGPGRPSAQQWADLLKAYALRAGQKLSVCRRNVDHQHFTGLPCPACGREALLAMTARGAGAARQAIRQTGAATRAAAPPPPAPGWRRPAVPAGRMARGPVRVARQPAHYPAGTPPLPPPRPQPLSPAAQRRLRRNRVGQYAGGLVGRAVRKVFEWLLAMIAVIVVLLLIRAFEVITQGGRPARPLPAPAALVADPVVVFDQSSATLSDYTIRYLRGEAAKAIESGAAAMAVGDTLGYQHALRKLRSEARRNPDPARGSQEREIRVLAKYAGAEAFATPAARDAEMLRLGEVLAQDYRDAEAAFALGWLMLAQGHRDMANQHFTHALWLDPDFAAAWYGWGLSAVRDGEFVGALAIAEALPRKASALDYLRPPFEALALGAVGEDPRRYERISARARRIAAGITGTPLPADVVRTSHLPLPPRSG